MRYTGVLCAWLVLIGGGVAATTAVVGAQAPATLAGPEAVTRVLDQYCVTCHNARLKTADLVLDTGAPVGDAMTPIDGMDTPVAPGSTVGGCMLVNAIKAEVADRLSKAGHPPKVLTAGAIVGSERATELFEAAYDEHARRLAKLYENLGGD